MAVETLERINGLETEREELAALHFAAMRVMDSRIGGGLGTFRVDGISEGQATELTEYVGQFVGQRMPRLSYDEDGHLFESGGVVVRDDHTKFTLARTHIDEETGEVRHYFKWNAELWDPEVAEAVAKAEVHKTRVERAKKYLSRSAVAALLTIEAFGFGMMLKGINDYAELKRQGADTEQLQDANTMSENGMHLMLGSMMVYGVAQIGVLGNEVIKEMRKGRKK